MIIEGVVINIFESCDVIYCLGVDSIQIQWWRLEYKTQQNRLVIPKLRHFKATVHKLPGLVWTPHVSNAEPDFVY